MSLVSVKVKVLYVIWKRGGLVADYNVLGDILLQKTNDSSGTSCPEYKTSGTAVIVIQKG